MSILRIAADNVSGADPVTITDAHGDVDTMAYHVRRLGKDMEKAGRYDASIVELDGIRGDEVRTVAAITGEPDVVMYVLNKALRTERSTGQASAETEAPEIVR